jgi:hypothetical protein
MSSLASLVYTVPQGGALLSALEAATVAVPIPSTIFQFLGLRLLSDVTVLGPPVVRTLDVSLVPAISPTATAQVLASQPTGSPITTITVGAAGTEVVAPPGVQITDTLGTGSGAAAKAFLDLATIAGISGGSGYGPNTFIVAYGGLPPGNGSPGETSLTYQEVLRVDMFAGGVGYSPKTTVAFVGGISPRGRAATGSVVLRGGVITAILVEDEGDEYLTAPNIVITDSTGAGSGALANPYMNPGKTVTFQGRPATITVGVGGGGTLVGIGIPDSGEGYISVPELVVVDPDFTGSGAILKPSMEVNKIVVTNGGEGYQQPMVTLVPYFKTLFPDTCDQRKPLFNLLTVALSQATRTQVIASAPVMS